jgi:muramoyltetrapeptide carboxypeptidase
MNIPKPLCKGNTIGIVAPASNLRDYTIKEVKEKLESYGYNVKIGKSCNLKYRGYLAGEDEIRALDLENMFLDKEVDAIMCLRGGYGCSRILNLINYDIVKQNPKIFLGFSDITALHIVFNQKCNLATYHGLMANRCIEWDEFSYNSMINSLNFKDELCIKNSSDINIKSLYEVPASLYHSCIRLSNRWTGNVGDRYIKSYFFTAHKIQKPHPVQTS